jgi:hypothetical protein
MTYVVRPKWEQVHPVSGKVTPVPGLSAQFRGRDRLFDTEAAQKTLGWTDEERKQVEEYLLGHQDFGYRLWLAPGQTTPEGLNVNVGSGPQEVRCGHFITKDGEIRQCKNKALVGQEFCGTHKPSLIKQGMLTTAD